MARASTCAPFVNRFSKRRRRTNPCADASHAWCSIYLPPFGWIDVDPTNNQLPQERHITLAWGRDYDDVSPIKGIILGGGRHSVRVAVDVIPGEEIQPT